MEWYVSAIVLFSIFLVLLFSGLHVGIAFIGAGIIGFLFFEQGVMSLPQAVRIMHDSLFSYGLLAIPLFILMAEVLEAGGANKRLYAAVQNTGTTAACAPSRRRESDLAGFRKVKPLFRSDITTDNPHEKYNIRLLWNRSCCSSVSITDFEVNNWAMLL